MIPFVSSTESHSIIPYGSIHPGFAVGCTGLKFSFPYETMTRTRIVANISMIQFVSFQESVKGGFNYLVPE